MAFNLEAKQLFQDLVQVARLRLEVGSSSDTQQPLAAFRALVEVLQALDSTGTEGLPALVQVSCWDQLVSWTVTHYSSVGTVCFGSIITGTVVSQYPGLLGGSGN